MSELLSMKASPASELFDITISEVRRGLPVAIHRMTRAVFADNATHAVHAFKMDYGWQDWYTEHGYNRNWLVQAEVSR